MNSLNKKIIFIAYRGNSTSYLFRGPTVRCLKGYSNTAIGLSAADIIIAILRNTQKIIPVSTLVQVYLNNIKRFVFKNKLFMIKKFVYLVDNK